MSDTEVTPEGLPVYSSARPAAATPIWWMLQPGETVDIIDRADDFVAVAIPTNGLTDCFLRPEDLGKPYTGPCATGWVDSAQPYSHNVLSMWRSDPELWAEAEVVFRESGGRADFLIHMSVLDYLCGGMSKYSIRYNEYRAHYPEAKYLLPVFLEIIRREGMRQEAWATTLAVQDADSQRFR